MKRTAQIFLCYARQDEMQVKELYNKLKLADFIDWRLPTVEEAMSLIFPKRYRNLHISPVFSQEQMGIWTADKDSNDNIWRVSFFSGYFDYKVVDARGYYVRAVRTGIA